MDLGSIILNEVTQTQKNKNVIFDPNFIVSVYVNKRVREWV